jgi:hypothetical protein
MLPAAQRRIAMDAGDGAASNVLISIRLIVKAFEIDWGTLVDLSKTAASASAQWLPIRPLHSRSRR